MDVRFRWHVPESGHEWKQLKGEHRLVWKEEKTAGFCKGYIPEVGLFREFAKLTTTQSRQEGAILRFADKYGDIVALPGSSFYRLSGRDAPPPEDGVYSRIIRTHASLRTWRYAIQHMRRAVNLWDQINDEKIGRAARPEANAELRTEVESALRDMTTPSCARACLNQKLELFVHPVNLLAFMWLTLARLVSREIVEQPCMGKSKSCVGYIYTGPGLKKTGTVTCSPACRKQKSRDKG